MDEFKNSFKPKMKINSLTQSINKLVSVPVTDRFVKKVEQDSVLKEISEFLERVSFEKFTNSMIERDFWTDSVDIAELRRNNNGAISYIGVNLYNINTRTQIMTSITLPEFRTLVTIFAAKNIEKNPENEVAIKEQYLKFMDFLKKRSPQS